MAEQYRPETRSNTSLKERIRAEPPRMYKVILHNDNYTTMEFVVNILVSVFHKSPPQATSIMLTVHNAGLAVVGRYTREIAETKTARARQLAREKKFPLRITMEQE